MKIFANHDLQMAAFMAERCSCGSPRESHEQVDGKTWGICKETGCDGFEPADDFEPDCTFNDELAGFEAAYGVSRA